MPLLQNPFGVHERALQLRDMRSTMIAANMANSDTPNYKARDINFRDIMQSAGPAGTMTVTDNMHMDTSFGAAGGNVMYRIPTSPSLDGNTVEMDLEQNHYTDNALRTQATLTFLNSKIKGIKSALRGE